MSLSRFPHPPTRDTTDRRRQRDDKTIQGTSTSSANNISSSSDTVSTRSEIASPTAVGSRLAELSLPPFPYRNSVILSDAIRSKKRRISPKRTPILPSIVDAEDNSIPAPMTGSPSSRVVPPSKRPRPSFQSSTRSFSKGSYEGEGEGTGSTGSSSLISFAWSSVDDAERDVVTGTGQKGSPPRQRHSPVPLEVLEEVKIKVPDASSSVAKALGLPPREMMDKDTLDLRDSFDSEDSRQDAINRFKGLLTTASSEQSRGRLQAFTEELRSSRGESFPQAGSQHRYELGRHGLRNEPIIHSELPSRDVSPQTSNPSPSSPSRYILFFFFGFLFPPLWLIGSFAPRRKRPPPREPIETLQIGMALTTDEVVQRRPSPASWVFSWATAPTTNTSSEKSIGSDRKWIWANRIAFVLLIVAIIVVIVIVVVILRPNKTPTVQSSQSASLAAFSQPTSSDTLYTQSIPSSATSLSLSQSLTKSQPTLLASYPRTLIPQPTSFRTMSFPTSLAPAPTANILRHRIR